MKDCIRFNELSNWVKIAVISGWVYAVLYSAIFAYYFLGGLFVALL